MSEPIELTPAGIEIKLRFVVDGVPYETLWNPYIPDGKHRTLTELEVLVDNGIPVIRTPFYSHGSRLHTSCREDGTIETSEE